MFNFMKKNNSETTDLAVKQPKKNGKQLVAKFLAAAMILSCVPTNIAGAYAAEEGSSSLSGIVSEGTTVVTSVMGTIWTFITGNAYTSFAVAVSVICAVIMIFKRLIGAARR